MTLIFSKDKSVKIVAYIFSKDKSGTFLFGCVRKLYNGGRIKHGIIKGAAGTNIVYHGKWTSIGGSQTDPIKHHLLWNIIQELKDEANIHNPLISSQKVDLSFFGLAGNKNNILKCYLVTKSGNNIIFLFRMKYTYFINYFPRVGRTSINYVYSSHGEIDAAQSYSTKEIIQLQNNEIINKNNNYFIKYFLTTFITIIVPFICKYSKHYQKKWININNLIKIIPDTIPRTISELYHKPYIL